MAKAKRESNLDLLRILCCVAVVMLHVSSRFKAGITDPNVFGALITTNIPTILLLDTLPRFAVPCFVMLAGAFGLGNPKNEDYRSYYRKTFRTIGIPALLFSLLYVLGAAGTQLKLVLAGGAGWSALLGPIKAWILGVPYYHMWYLYAMIGLYILTPVLIRWKASVSTRTYRTAAAVLLLLCTVSGWTSRQKFYWDLGRMFCYTGYYVMGNVLREALSEKKSQWKSIACMAGALLAEGVVLFVQYRHSMEGISESEELYSLVGSFNPLIVLSAVLLFAGFCLLKADVDCGWFVKRAFLVYLFHAGVLTHLMGYILRADVALCAVTIPGASLAVLAVSFVLSLVYERLWAYLERRWDVSRRVTDLLIPEK